ncbi:MAG: ATP-binding cassette domain-containing protein [Alphaproteobacteria bacterium]|nr:ATP-binding cassette domain-containing protein [Alphaproteobacteria bacterium]
MATPASPTRRDYRALRRLLGFVRPYRLQVSAALVALVIAASTVLVFGAGLRWLIDRGFAAGDPALLDQALIGLLAVIAVLAASTYGRSYLVSWLGERVTADIRRAVFDNLVRLSPGFYETTRTGEVLSRLSTDTTVVQTIVSSSASQALRNILLFVGGTVMMAVTSPKLTGLVFVVVPLVVSPIIIFGRRVRGLSRESQDRLGDAGADIDETLNAIRTVQAFNREAADAERVGRRIEAAFEAAISRSRTRSLLAAVVILLVFSAVGAILWIGGHDAIAGRISAGELSAFVFYAVVVAGSVGIISEFTADVQRAAGAAERLFELLDAAPAIAAPADPVTLPVPARGAIAFERVSFRYPSRPEQLALADFDLAIAPGERIAFVGPSGAGKTTVFNLLLRFYDPEGGVVRLDGVELQRADPAEIRARIGIVAQDATIFAADVIDNIRYGRPGATDAEVRRAADAAAATEFIERLPQGYRTYLGERGVRLSGGQRQRIAIARALLRDPAVLLLDEATSALDAESERLVQQALDRVMDGRTVLIIAHRLATVLKAQRIAVLDHGRLVALGDHAALLRQGGLYARLAALQFVDPAA